MKKLMLSLVATLLGMGAGYAGNLTGTWSGRLDITPRNSLRLVFHIDTEAVTLDSPDQNAYGLPCETQYLSADSVSVRSAQLGLTYAGRLSNDTIKGKFRQGMFTTPLSLTRGTERLNRPQTPLPPYPYTTEEVTIETPEALLAGTLTLPDNATKDTPVAVLVSGSGLQNRDEELFEHRPFAVIADYLARRGIATLRYDDRGYGESKGDNATATTADYAQDARAVVDWLRRSGRFSRTGLIGHSEGGMIGYMLGAKPGVLDFLVSVAGPSVSGAEINAWQNKVALENQGIDSVTAEDFRGALLEALRYRINNIPLPVVVPEMMWSFYPQFDDSPVTKQLSETIAATLTMENIHPWMEYFLRYDPTDDLKALALPTMMIYGGKDCQVPPSLNLEPARENVPHAVVRLYPDLNHLMQHAVSGNVEEYKEIEESFSPEVLSDITGFIRSAINEINSMRN